MKKPQHQIWEQYRHPEFLASLNVNVNEEKLVRLFLKRGTIGIINDILKETRPTQLIRYKFSQKEKLQA